MLFNSFQFIIFFICVVYAYFLMPRRFRWIFLLGASYYFYMCWRPEYVILIMVSTLVDYIAGIKISEADRQIHKKGWLMASLACNLGLLFAFKYFNFFNDAIRTALNSFNVFYNVPSFKVLLPIGISFYTFQTLSYTIDVYREKKKPERHLGIFALYVAFFPQLVAGPIERSTRLLPQFHKEMPFDWERMKSGMQLMLLGFFKKIVLADNLALFVDSVYGSPSEFSGGALLMATYCFAFQIYYDFSGYSDIAIGAARILGYDLMINFRQPYLSSSFAEFWQRWHISLSSWFRDYLYIPLGGNRCAMKRWMVNIAVVFVLSGLWHGANWTFLAWGALHGTYFITERIITRSGEKLRKNLPFDIEGRWFHWIRVFLVFNLVSLAWVFFRAQSITDAIYITKTILFHFYEWTAATNVLPYAHSLILWAVFIAFIEGGMYWREKVSLLYKGAVQWPMALRWSAYYGMVFSIFTVGHFGGRQFIYFQF